MLSDRDEVLKQMRETFVTIPDKPKELTDKDKLEIAVKAIRQGIERHQYDHDVNDVLRMALRKIGKYE